MMWLHFILFVQFIGVPWPVIQAFDNLNSEPFYSSPKYPPPPPDNSFPGVTSPPDNSFSGFPPSGPYFAGSGRPTPQPDFTSPPGIGPFSSNFANPNPGSSADNQYTYGPEPSFQSFNERKPFVSTVRPPVHPPHHPPHHPPTPPHHPPTPPHHPPTPPPHPHPHPHPYTSPKPHPKDDPLPYPAIGVAFIHVHNTPAPLCSGIHLKPWILLTVAECVIKRNPDDLYASVTRLDPSHGRVTVPVKVDFYEIHPGFRYAHWRYNNLAIVLIRSDPSWNVGGYILPYLASKSQPSIQNPGTYVDEWLELLTPHNRTYLLSSEKKGISVDYSACKGQKSDKHFFCVESGYKRDNYVRADIGIPLFQKLGSQKILMGLYLGEDLNRPVAGHKFLDISFQRGWIEMKLFQYPFPPLRV